MPGKLTTALIAVIAALLVGVVYYQGQTTTLQSDVATIKDERDKAQSILNNQVRTVQLFNDIAKASEHEKTNIRNNSEVRVAAIKKDISADECATRSIPVAAVERLRKHANQIRSGATGTDTNKLTF
ncbi:exotoxin [Yersinia pseudotuberculosis]|uniref:exotoxin n=1 Tax=Yersinia pseudotuberculosis TaxID=633 RepID=UPI000D2BF49F|nr:exotoxin [Yersinia pseudotuberculosis]PSH23537.1 exotoxin [Yersinia pseudotuberculosis]